MTMPRLRAKTATVLSSALVCVLLIVVVKNTGPLPQIRFGRDLIYLLDGAWKLKWTALPQTEYYSPVGSLAFLSVAIAMDLGGSIVKAPMLAMCAFGIVLLPMALSAAFRRLQPVMAWLAVLVIMATAMAPHVAGFSSDAWSYAAFYERWQQALFCTLILLVAAAPPNRPPRSEAIDGAIAGIVITALIFLNIALGVLALVIWIAFGITSRRHLFHYMAAAIVGLFVGLIILALLKWNMPNLLTALSLEVRAWRDRDAGTFLERLLKLAPGLSLIALLTGLWCGSGVLTSKGGLFERLIEAVVFFICVSMAAVFIAMTRQHVGEVTDSAILGVAALILLTRIIAAQRNRDAPDRPFSQGGGLLIAIAAIVTLFLAIPQTSRNLYAVIKAAVWKSQGRTLPAGQVFQNGPLQSLEIEFFGGNPPTPTSYVGTVMDGLALLARTNNNNKTVIALDYSNPFNLVRGTKPSAALSIAGPADCVYPEAALPPAQAVFNGQDVVLVPKWTRRGDDKLLRLLDHYRSYLADHYFPAGESQQWQLLLPK